MLLFCVHIKYFINTLWYHFISWAVSFMWLLEFFFLQEVLYIILVLSTYNILVLSTCNITHAFLMSISMNRKYTFSRNVIFEILLIKIPQFVLDEFVLKLTLLSTDAYIYHFNQITRNVLATCRYVAFWWGYI